MLTRDRRVASRIPRIILGVLVLIATSLAACAWPAVALGASARPIVPSLETTELLSAYSRQDKALGRSCEEIVERGVDLSRFGLELADEARELLPLVSL